MIEALLVSLDLTPASQGALTAAAPFAARLGVPIDLVVVSSPGLAGADQFELAQAAEEVGVRVRDTVSLTGDDVAAELTEYAATRPGSTLWMATHGRSRIGALVLGTTAEAVVRKTASPVVLVGPSAVPGATWSTVVACLDGSDRSDEVLPAAEAWASSLRCRLRVLEVLEPRESEPVDTSHDVLHDNRPAAAIVHYAARLNVSMIAVATHGRGGLSRAVLGSTAMRVVHEAPCPVLVQRA